MPLSEARKRGNQKWDAKNLRRLSLALPVELHQKMKHHVEQTHETTNGFIKRAIAETIQRDEEKPV